MRYFRTVCMWAIAFAAMSCSGPQLKIAVIGGDSPAGKAETEALAGVITAQHPGSRVTVVDAGQPGGLGGYDLVWLHIADTTGLAPSLVGAGEAFREYVSGGGELVLSMEAVKLLNEWGIEPHPVETFHFTVRDKGFGRKLGFHAFREHPLFDGLHGGAYTWHGKEDNTARILGFTGGDVPSVPGSRVIGTLWEYIYYHPEDKVIWETPLGDGKILAVGCCLYYGRDNFHTAILEKFTANCVGYMTGQESDTPQRYWNYDPLTVSESPVALGTSPEPGPAPQVPAGHRMVLTKKAGANSFDLPSRRGVVIAQEKGGIEEVWTHPFLSLRDLRVFVDFGDGTQPVCLSDLEPQLSLTPSHSVRGYDVRGTKIIEVITPQHDGPITLLNYAWEGKRPSKIIVDLKSNLRFMWPYDTAATGSLLYHWDTGLNAFVVRNGEEEFCSLVGSPAAGQLLAAGRYDGFNYKGSSPEGVPTDKHQAAASLAFDVGDTGTFSLVLAAGNEGLDQVVQDYSKAIADPSGIAAAASAYYNDYLGSVLAIETPDPVFNEGYRWAVASSVQFIAETPGIGTSLMAGYSSSRRGWGGAQPVSGRPGYAWYFGRDAVWAGFAFLGMGDHRTVKEVLEVLIRYQQVDGKIYHELTTSGSVHYDASDATPLFVNLMAAYLRASGDTGFVRDNMDAVHRAMDYCYSTDTDGDGIIEITNVGHGWLEGGALYGSHTEFYLAGVWAAALEDAAYLSGVVADKTRAGKYSADAVNVKAGVEKFWNPEGFYNYGMAHDGTYTDEFIMLTSVPVYFGVTDPGRSRRMVEKYASASFSTDWGTRLLWGEHPMFNPTAYHFGSVWPLFTGWTGLAEYNTGRYLQGFSRIYSNLINYRGISMGRVPEVLHGLEYRPSGVTQHQCWSETMVIQPLVEGMLGFRPDALAGGCRLSPRLPFDWAAFTADNLRVGEARLGVSLEKSAQKSVYTFTADGKLSVAFHPAFPPGTVVNRIEINGSDLPFDTKTLDEYTEAGISFDAEGHTTVTVYHDEGPSALPSPVDPVPGQPSSGFRIMSQDFDGQTLTVTVEGRPGSSYPLRLYLPSGFTRTEGAGRIENLGGNVYEASVTFPASDKVYTTTDIKIKI